MREAIRVAKERNRSKMRGPRTRTVEARGVNHDFWSDERTGEEGNPEETIND